VATGETTTVVDQPAATASAAASPAAGPGTWTAAAALTGLLRGRLGAELDALIREAIPESWHLRPAGMTAAEQQTLTYARLREAHRALPRISTLLNDPWSYCAVLERAAVIDPRLLPPLLAHYTHTTAAVRRFGDAQRTRTLLSDLDALAVFGCAATTEAGAADARTIPRTHATYDLDRCEFVLEMLDDTAIKRPVLAGHPGIGKLAAVRARLVVDCFDCGVFLFAVPLRAADGRPEPGVLIEPLAEDGLLSADRAAVSFHRMRLPAKAWLSDGAWIEDGIFHDPAGLTSERTGRTLGLDAVRRQGVTAVAAAVGRAAAVMALTVVERPDQRSAALTALACAWVATAAAARAKDRSCDDEPDAPAPSPSALLTAGATDLAARVLECCRACCGPTGSQAADQLERYRGLIQNGMTDGADERLPRLAAGRALAERPDPQAAPEPDRTGRLTVESCRELARTAEHVLRRRLRGRIEEAVRRGTEYGAAWEYEHELALDVATAAGDRLLLDLAAESSAAHPAAQAILAELAALFALDWAERRAGLLADLGLLSPGGLGRVRGARTVAGDRLLPHAEALIEAFGPPAQLLAP
jgi:acyl-CoA oxidase